MAPSSESTGVGHAPRPRLSTAHGFALLALGQVLAAAFLNRILLDDRVVAIVARAGGASPDEALTAAGRWVLAGYIATPLLLLVRVGGAALLIQLALLPFLGNPPLGRIFRATLWGGAVLLAGNALQAAWLSTLPPPLLLQGSADSLPGAIVRILPRLSEGPSSLRVLAEQVTVFDLAWPVVVGLALDLRPQVGFGRTLVSVGGVWAALVLSRWILLLYLLRLA